MAVPIANNAVDDHAEIELHAKSVENGAVINTWDGEHGLVDLECVRTFGGFYGQI